MQDQAQGQQDQARVLRLVGVHEDGAHLLVSAPNGDVFRLPLDEALRRAVSRPAPQRPASAPGSRDGAMTPRQIQAEIRAGATAQEVAESSGVPLARVQRFEGPVLAEREHMARRAQAVEVPGTLPNQDALRGPHLDGAATLGEMAAYRLSLYGVPANSVEWDSWRRPDGQWTVVARFARPENAPSSIGEEPPAMWTFHPVHRTITNANRWAQQLSELEPLEGPAPRRRLSAVVDRPFDVEAAEAARPVPAASAPVDPESELLDMLRARRGQRLGVDEDGDDALALLLTHGIPAAHPRPAEVEPEQGPEPANAQLHDQSEGPREHAESEPLTPPRGGITSLLSRLSPRMHDGDDPHLTLRPGLSGETRQITVVPPARPQQDGDPQDSPQNSTSNADTRSAAETGSGGHEEARRPAGPSRPAAPEPKRPSRAKRSSVPSWDEIVFGTKGD
ncbi:DNA-binding protein [Sinomonas cellulolyticus]|uniref:DUF3071 domain-containing protein n=1 Tax=Sinomonas cellulolyticus TaxID=2801916 RepID=A0ABS1K187_9MICC|nr:DUF3071 domain-containing protein [Sinomonas cellulolyticus]GHG41239.1 DNA-binding protein [Sinomonas sp. KCTC 49339]